MDISIAFMENDYMITTYRNGLSFSHFTGRKTLQNSFH